MAEIAAMTATSKDVRRMLGLSLHGWENTMVVTLIVAGAFAFAAGAATWAVVKLQRAELAHSTDELARYKADAATALGVAQENISKAQADTENLRRQNLELELALAPRAIEQFEFSNSLKQFAGMTCTCRLFLISKRPSLPNNCILPLRVPAW
jgi:hypothetical protein